MLVLRGGWLFEQGEHPNSLLRNNRDGTFNDVTEEAGLLTFHPTQTAAWGDFDNDGWVDIFVGNESDGKKTRPCQLFHNNGDGTFTECADGLGIAAVGYVKGVVWGDYNNYGGPGYLYVSRMGGTNILYRNEGPKRNPGSTWRSLAWKGGSSRTSRIRPASASRFRVLPPGSGTITTTVGYTFSLPDSLHNRPGLWMMSLPSIQGGPAPAECSPALPQQS